MSKDLSVSGSSARSEKASETWLQPPASARAENRSAAAAHSDEVRLSKLHEILTFPDVAARIDRLQMEVSRREYSVPALEISRSILQEHLSAGIA